MNIMQLIHEALIFLLISYIARLVIQVLPALVNSLSQWHLAIRKPDAPQQIPSLPSLQLSVGERITLEGVEEGVGIHGGEHLLFSGTGQSQMLQLSIKERQAQESKPAPASVGNDTEKTPPPIQQATDAQGDAGAQPKKLAAFPSLESLPVQPRKKPVGGENGASKNHSHPAPPKGGSK